MKTMPAPGNSPDHDPRRNPDPWEDRDAPQDNRDAPFSPKRLIPLTGQARRNRDRREARIGWQMAALGWEFTSQVIAGVLLGWGFDYLFPQFKPNGIMVGAVAGILVGLVTFLRNALKLNNELENPGSTGSPKDKNGGSTNG